MEIHFGSIYFGIGKGGEEEWRKKEKKSFPYSFNLIHLNIKKVRPYWFEIGNRNPMFKDIFTLETLYKIYTHRLGRLDEWESEWTPFSISIDVSISDDSNLEKEAYYKFISVEESCRSFRFVSRAGEVFQAMAKWIWIRALWLFVVVDFNPRAALPVEYVKRSRLSRPIELMVMTLHSRDFQQSHSAVHDQNQLHKRVVVLINIPTFDQLFFGSKHVLRQKSSIYQFPPVAGKQMHAHDGNASGRGCKQSQIWE